jgi:hypothetical protein
MLPVRADATKTQLRYRRLLAADTVVGKRRERVGGTVDGARGSLLPATAPNLQYRWMAS